MKVTHAICRRPATTFADGLTTTDEGRPNFDRACAQFDAYVEVLRDLGVDVDVLDPLEAHPDAHFVEDVAVITPEAILLTRPGHASRRGEVDAITDVLSARAPVVPLVAPATLDGGDVLRVDSTFFVGLSARTNSEGAEEFAGFVRDEGFDCVEVAVDAGLHLKSGVNLLDDETVVLTRGFADDTAFAHLRHVVVDDTEAYAACALRINDGVIVPSGYPQTRDAIAKLGFPVQELDMSEFRKMDGGLTCLSLRFGGWD